MTVASYLLIYLLVAVAGLLLLALVGGGLVMLGKTLQLGATPWLTLCAVVALCGLAAVFGFRGTAIESQPRDVRPSEEVAGSVPGLARPPGVEKVAAVSDVVQLAEMPERPAPDWVSDPPASLGEDTPIVIRSGPHARILDCERVLNDQLQRAVRDYVDENIAHGKGQPISIPRAALRDLVVVGEHVETRRHSFGDMHEIYQRLSFGREAHEQLWKAARHSVVRQRLRKTSVGLVALLLAVGTVHGYLRVDQATAGRYRRRLGWSAATLGGLLVTGMALLMTLW